MKNGYVLKQKLKEGQDKTLADVAILSCQFINGNIIFAVGNPNTRAFFKMISLQEVMNKYELDYARSYVAIKKIETDEQYEKILSRIDDIFDAKPKTTAGDELVRLCELVKEYEDINYPMS